MTRLSVVLASASTGIPARTIQRWAYEGRLPSETVSGVLQVDPAQVIRVADSRGPGGRLPRARHADRT